MRTIRIRQAVAIAAALALTATMLGTTPASSYALDTEGSGNTDSSIIDNGAPDAADSTADESAIPGIGDTFTSYGFVYTITDNENFTVALSGVDGDATLHLLRPRVDNDQSIYDVTSVEEQALASLTGRVIIYARAANIAADALASVGNDVTFSLLVNVDTTLQSPSSFMANGHTVTLPQNRTFNEFLTDGGASLSFTNDTGSPVELYIIAEDFQPTYDPIIVEPGETFDSATAYPSLYTGFDLLYREVESQDGWQRLTVTDIYDRFHEILVDLPSGIAHDATLEFELQSTPGIQAGYFTSDWDTTRTVTLSRGQAQEPLTLSSPYYGAEYTQNYTVYISVEDAPEDASKAVYIDGVYHDQNFTSDDGSIVLEYDDAGKPTITLNNATINATGGRPAYGGINAAGILSYTDLTLRLKGTSTINTDGSNRAASNILTPDTLTIIGEDDEATLIVNNANNYASDVSLIEAGQIDVQHAKLDITLQSGYWIYSMLYGQRGLSVNDSEINLTASDGATTTFGLTATADDADIPLSNTRINANGDFTAAVIYANYVSINGQSQLDLSNTGGMTLGAWETLSIDLTGSGFVRARNLNSGAYAVRADTIELNGSTFISNPVDARIVTSDKQFLRTTIVDESGNVIRDVTFRAEPAPNAVYVNGVYHEQDFTSDDGTISLTYTDGKPTLTLDGAHITELGDPDAEFASAGIFAETDLTIQLKGESVIELESGVFQAKAIQVLGALTVIGDSAERSPARLSVTLTHIPLDYYDMGTVVFADEFNMQNTALDLTYRATGAHLRAYCIASMRDATIANSTITLTVPDGSRPYTGIFSYGDISLTDVDLTSTGALNYALDASNVDISGQSHLDIAHIANRRGAAIEAREGTVRFDLQGSGSVRIGDGQTNTAEGVYAVYAEHIVLADGTEISEPTQGQVIQFELDNDYYLGTYETIGDADGNIASSATIKAKATPEPEQPEQPDDTEQPEQPGGSDSNQGNDNQASGDKLSNSGSETIPLTIGALTLALLGLCAALATGVARRSRGTRNGRSRR
ncbi:hypothetical protein BLEM_1643 [Bifidobacterium lemurum]|uniref:FHA domain-containing protein n=1 Tax=Bifidobacterium lemurum TaxID=1603886 RepID=A0A261FPN5_9BIFI|nr:hypothetical protein [Bifidobacterium lemurum]OZG60923.1 hypothetical protein BLEM_1643 [Bifidobacterium lemurum]QOL35002.1 hypothetical protein BL8807_03750 [Bifidobacterium lemurum]